MDPYLSCLSTIQNPSHLKAPLQFFPASAPRFDSLHVDIVGPLPPFQGYIYLFTCVDRYTCWTEAILRLIPPLNLVHVLCSPDGFPVLGFLWQSPLTKAVSLSRPFGWTHASLGSNTSSHNSISPQANGLVERFHRSFKDELRARLAGAKWVSDLPMVHLGIRISLKEDLSRTAAELVYGTTLRLPGNFFSAPSSMDQTSFVSNCVTLCSPINSFPRGPMALQCLTYPGISNRHPMLMCIGMATNTLWFVPTSVHSKSK